MNFSEILDNCVTGCSKNSCACLINLSAFVVEKYAKNHRKKTKIVGVYGGNFAHLFLVAVSFCLPNFMENF